MHETNTTRVEVAIVGTGFSGLGMAIKLREAGESSFVILEKADGVGGTWRENTYPGCACDVPSHLYSFSFEPNPGWTRLFAPQGEIRDYLERCTDKYGLRPHIRFGEEITLARFDEARARWSVRTKSGLDVDARYLVLGTGALHEPLIPKVKGRERFAGKAFHSAKWDHSVDLSDKRVAVIGTGASAIQFVPAIAPKVAKMTVFQRTPPWISRKPDRPISFGTRKFFAAVPAAQKAARAAIYSLMEARALGFTVAPRAMRLEAAMAKRHIREELGDTELARKVTPTYTPGCKRILISNDYYPALKRDNVALVTDDIEEITEDAVITADGARHEVDVIVYGTGFRVADALTRIRIEGLGGVALGDAWKGGIEALLGTTVAGFPNLFTLLGPNTGLGHSSMVFMIEAQIHYAMELMRKTEELGARYANVREGAQKRFNERLQKRIAKSVWATGCMSWYLDAKGRNSTVWPGFTAEFWARTRSVVDDDYEFVTARASKDAGELGDYPTRDLNQSPVLV